DHVERRLVCPLQILEHEDGRPARCELADQRRGNGLWLSAFVHDLKELAARLLRDIDERPQRRRREERIAGAPEKTGRVVLMGAEPSQEGRLADARLAGHGNEATAMGARDVPEEVREGRGRFDTLE